MRIVALDGYTLNPGDLSWDPIRALGDFEAHDRTPPAQIIDRASGAGVALTNKVPFDANTLRSLPNLKLIAVTATGYNIIDTAAANAHGVVVCNVPEYGTPNVAQHVFALLLELASRTGHHARTVREGKWSAAPDWCYWDYPLIELNGLTLGIVGYGRIGRAVARIANAFGMRVIALRRRAPQGATDPGVTAIDDLDAFLRESDVISLHAPLTAHNAQMVNANFLAKMKPTAFLINTARGGLVDEQALAEALNEGRIAGGGLDVLTKEPPTAGNPLLTAKNCVITPHIAWASRPARQRLLDVTAANIRAFLAGRPENVVNP
jgi:glycerate dehydrogenase